MNDNLYTILRQIAEVQAKRRANWNGLSEPKDANLEAIHTKELESLRAKLP